MGAEIIIGGKEVRNFSDPFVIAEVGINHNGEIEKAFQMIEVTKSVGADAVKFQTFKVHELISDPNLTYTYQSQGKEVTESMIDLFTRYEFNREQWLEVKKKCDQVGICFLSTPQNITDLNLLMEIGIDAVKVGSDDFTNLPLLKEYSKTGKPLIISSGMADMGEIFQALDTVGAFEGYPVVLLLCISQYPTPIDDINLRRIQTLMKAFPDIPIGFSDHSQGALASSVATGLGACLIEKHFTLDRNLAGPDHWFSEDPDSLKDLLKSIRFSYRMMGSSILKPSKEEEKMKYLARRSVAATKDIGVGEVFTTDNTGLNRPGDGLAPRFFDDVIGKVATRPLKKGDVVKMGDFSHG